MDPHRAGGGRVGKVARTDQLFCGPLCTLSQQISLRRSLWCRWGRTDSRWQQITVDFLFFATCLNKVSLYSSLIYFRGCSTDTLEVSEVGLKDRKPELKQVFLKLGSLLLQPRLCPHCTPISSMPEREQQWAEPPSRVQDPLGHGAFEEKLVKRPASPGNTRNAVWIPRVPLHEH